MRTSQKALALLGCLACLWGLAGTAQANGTFTWYGGDGNWDIPGNWTPSTVPGNDGNFPYDYEIIPSGTVLVTVTGPSGTKFSAGLELGPMANLQTYTNFTFCCLTEPRNVAVKNHGIIQLLEPAAYQGLSAADTVVTFTGTGRLILAGNGLHELTNGGWGGSFNNASLHTIEGAGSILTNFTNRDGWVIANRGTISFGSGYAPTVDNTEGIMMAAGPTDALRISCPFFGGKLYPGLGKVILQGARLRDLIFHSGVVEVETTTTFMDGLWLTPGVQVNVAAGQELRCWNGDGGAMTLLNQGAITLGDNSWLGMTSNTVTLSGSGRVVLAGNASSGLGNGGWGGACTNFAGHTVRGRGRIECPFTNHGILIAENGLLQLQQNFTGAGPVYVADNATLELTASVQFGDFSMSQLAAWIVWWGGKVVDLKGNFFFEQQDPAKWTFQDNQVTLQMSGGGGVAGPQFLEVGGEDFGAAADGYLNNFSVPVLRVTGTNTYACLLDAIDNGHWESAREALYVETLEVHPDATLNLKGLHLYAKRSGIIYRVMAGEGSLYGHGTIIDVPLPPGRAVPGIIMPLLLN